MGLLYVLLGTSVVLIGIAVIAAAFMREHRSYPLDERGEHFTDEDK